MQSVGRPTQPADTIGVGAPATVLGHRGLDHEEALIFELGASGRCGVDLDTPAPVASRLGPHARKAPVGLPGLSEPQVVRHYVRLSRRNYAIDMGLYPLGSCTMKHNPRLNEKMARLPGFADLHPLAPMSTVQGAFALMDDLAHWLTTLTGMPGVALSPKAGAHGELCGLMAIRAAHEARGQGGVRKRVLVPESAHGPRVGSAAQPATASSAAAGASAAGASAFLAPAAESVPAMPYLRMKRSTRPSVSRIFWVPV